MYHVKNNAKLISWNIGIFRRKKKRRKEKLESRSEAENLGDKIRETDRD